MHPPCSLRCTSRIGSRLREQMIIRGQHDVASEQQSCPASVACCTTLRQDSHRIPAPVQYLAWQSIGPRKAIRTIRPAALRTRRPRDFRRTNDDLETVLDVDGASQTIHASTARSLREIRFTKKATVTNVKAGVLDAAKTLKSGDSFPGLLSRPWRTGSGRQRRRSGFRPERRDLGDLRPNAGGQ